ncbi:hypothetical protein D9M68_760100 [compost metagenome]
MDGGANTHIGGATADVARHRLIDISVRGCAIAFQQGHGTHDLAGLAVTALHHIKLLPGLLHRLACAALRDAFDGLDLRTDRSGHRRHARTYRLPTHMHGASTAHRHAATKLGAGELQGVAQHPQQRRIGSNVDTHLLVIDVQRDHEILRRKNCAVRPMVVGCLRIEPPILVDLADATSDQ